MFIELYILELYLHHPIILSCHQPSLATPPYRSSLPASPQSYTCILTELQYVGSSWSSCLCSAMCRGPLEYITYELVPTTPAVFCMPVSSNLDSFRDEWLVAVQLLLCGVLPLGPAASNIEGVLELCNLPPFYIPFLLNKMFNEAFK